MKKILSIFYLVFAVIAFSACTAQVEQLFDQSASERIQQTMNTDLQVLQCAPNGWRAEYYGDLSYGGYNVFFKFNKDNTVTVASEKAGDHHNAGVDDNGNAITCTSSYKVEQSQGVILSFNEYNDVFTYFTDPVNDDYGMSGEGFYGDLEFRIIKATADSVVLEGKKHEDKVVMYPVPESKTWGEYITELSETENFMVAGTYELTFDGQTTVDSMAVVTNYRTLYFIYYENGERKTTVAPYVVNDDGYKFYKSYSIKGHNISGFLRGESESEFCAIDDENVQIWAEVPSLYDQFKDGRWFVAYSTLGPVAQPQWDILKEDLKTSSKSGDEETLYYAFFGDCSSISSKYSTGFYCQISDAQCYNKLDITKVSDNEITLRRPASGHSSDGKTYYNKHGLKEAMAPFIGTSGKTFTLSTDNGRHPSYMILTDQKNPDNVIKLFSTGINYPFNY